MGIYKSEYANVLSINFENIKYSFFELKNIVTVD